VILVIIGGICIFFGDLFGDLVVNHLIISYKHITNTQ